MTSVQKYCSESTIDLSVLSALLLSGEFATLFQLIRKFREFGNFRKVRDRFAIVKLWINFKSTRKFARRLPFQNLKLCTWRSSSFFLSLLFYFIYSIDFSWMYALFLFGQLLMELDGSPWIKVTRGTIFFALFLFLQHKRSTWIASKIGNRIFLLCLLITRKFSFHSLTEEENLTFKIFLLTIPTSIHSAQGDSSRIKF